MMYKLLAVFDSDNIYGKVSMTKIMRFFLFFAVLLLSASSSLVRIQ